MLVRSWRIFLGTDMTGFPWEHVKCFQTELWTSDHINLPNVGDGRLQIDGHREYQQKMVICALGEQV
jgi:hypothetical protein